MAFKKSPPPSSVPDSPDKLFLDLPRRKYTGLLDHQGQILRTYAKEGTSHRDVALQLPTGSGKTLVGLLIAEWRRRRLHEKVVFLCPTKQLVNQVVEEAKLKYGLDVDGFTGSAQEYDPVAKARYTNGDRVAVTTYNSLFNTHPFFSNPDLIIIDDAHAAENYIAQLWTLRVERELHAALFAALAGVLKPILEPYLFARLTGDCTNPEDRSWVDKIPTPEMIEISNDLREVLDVHTNGSNLRHSWSILRDHLRACQMYISATEILIRPLIPPTWTHAPFSGAKQRIFMSATLGAGGDLERLTGRKKIKRLAIPDGWDKQGIGRRFFIFPGMSFDEEESIALRRNLMQIAGRSLVLVPSKEARNAIKYDVETELHYITFAAEDIEASRKPFVDSEKAVAIVANRYDGIDFPGDDCRLLFIEGLPRAANLQERFLLDRMGANLLLNDRVQTRVLQAIGRCTRGLNDFSAVVINGEELADYLADRKRRTYLHPELQAEIEFGIEQSQEVTTESLVENFGIFLEHEEAWEDVNQDILAKRDAATKADFPAMNELESAVDFEIEFQVRLWQEDYETAFESAREVLGRISHSDLQGYRALWHYLAGSAALLAANAGVSRFEGLAREQYIRAKETARSVPWLVALSRQDEIATDADKRNITVLHQVERLELTLARLGKIHNRAYTKCEKEILDGLANPAGFEPAQQKLGELLGFIVGKVEEDASPDPWWLTDDICIVFEDHAGAKGIEAVIDATKARQAASHPDWIQSHVDAAKGAHILSVLVTPAQQAKKGAEPSLNRVSLWPLDEFRKWAENALSVVREMRTSFTEPGDLEWRIRTAEAFEENNMDAFGLYQMLEPKKASLGLKIIE